MTKETEVKEQFLNKALEVGYTEKEAKKLLKDIETDAHDMVDTNPKIDYSDFLCFLLETFAFIERPVY